MKGMSPKRVRVLVRARVPKPSTISSGIDSVFVHSANYSDLLDVSSHRTYPFSQPLSTGYVYYSQCGSVVVRHYEKRRLFDCCKRAHVLDHCVLVHASYKQGNMMRRSHKRRPIAPTHPANHSRLGTQYAYGLHKRSALISATSCC